MALSDNQRAYYKMEDANDATANAYNLTNSGSVSFATAGKIGNSAGKFNGSNQRLGRTDAMGLTSTSANTWSAWVKFSAVGNGYVFDFSTNSGANRRFLIYCSTDKLVLYVGTTDNAITTGASSITTGVWYHVVLTHNSGSFELFLNGVSKGTATPTGSGSGANYLSIGNAGDTFGAPVDGWVDEVGVWGRVLSSTEVSDLYNSGNGNQYPYATNVTVSATVITATFSAPTRTVTGTANVTASTPSATFSTQAPSISGGASTTVGVVSATFSIPLPNIITPDALVNASVVSASFSTQAPSVTGQAIVSSSVLTATFSQPSASFVGDVSITPSAQNATFTVQAPTILAIGNVTVSATVVSGTFSIQSPTITAETFTEAGVVSATFSTLSVTVTATRSVTVDASVMTATFSVVKPLRKVGGLWTAQPRNEGVWVPQGRIA